jgi:hypothetical protein
MYLPSASSILPGDRERAAQKQACAQARRNDAAVQSVLGRLELWQTITSPADLAQMFGAQLGANALMMQNDTATARQDALLGPGIAQSASTPASVAAQLDSIPTVQQVIASAPKSYSLNGQPSQVNGCTWAPAPQVPLPPAPRPTMPLQAPTVIQTPIGPATVPGSPGTPHWTNLCWAFKNGAIDPSQFDPTEYAALQYRCMQLGYVGGFPPPPNTQAYLTAGRRDGTLPHIQVTPELLDAIQPAPPFGATPMTAAQSYAAAGLTGYAPSWSDALVTDSQSQMDNPDAGVGAWITSHPWLSLAIAVGGAVVLSRRSR